MPWGLVSRWCSGGKLIFLSYFWAQLKLFSHYFFFYVKERDRAGSRRSPTCSSTPLKPILQLHWDWFRFLLFSSRLLPSAWAGTGLSHFCRCSNRVPFLLYRPSHPQRLGNSQWKYQGSAKGLPVFFRLVLSVLPPSDSLCVLIGWTFEFPIISGPVTQPCCPAQAQSRVTVHPGSEVSASQSTAALDSGRIASVPVSLWRP